MDTIRSRVALLGALALLLLVARPATPADPEPARACAALAELNTDRFRVDTAEWVQANANQPGHCLFRVMLDARASGMEGMSYGTGIELRLPVDWNGRLLFQGGGGLNGVLSPAMGRAGDGPSALQRGFAVVSTDSGHRARSSTDARFGSDQQAKLDFGYAAVDRSTREAKALLQRYYGKPPQYTYFMGCSTGGREGMMAAQRSPLLFDGIIAGDGPFNFTRLTMNQVFSVQTITRIAPKGADGKPDLSRAFTDAQLKGVADAVLGKCDALDGLKDGMINDFRACKFDPAEQICDAAKDKRGAACMTKTQADALRTVMNGAKNSRGESLYGSTPYDTGIAAPAWRSIHLGGNGRAPGNASLGRDSLTQFSMTPAAPDLDILKFDFDKDVARTYETAAISDAVATLHSSFAGHGGKLILYQGMSDQGMYTNALTGWYEKITPRDAGGPQAWARLFVVPGMLHCGGGQATDRFDMLAAIQDWVEKGKAPDRVVATGNAFPGRSRPLCPYPKVARYDGGNTEDAASFSCR
jgi:feruloyl esterase